MGLGFATFLKKPNTTKESTDEGNETLKCGTSCMQGWRLSQQDAHNCILDFDEDAAFFGVYDGHGGHEVAQYCSQELPNFIKNTKAYIEGDIEKALIDGILGFDEAITSEDVVKVLKTLAGVDNDEEPGGEESVVEENIKSLYEEATMPIEEIIKKYTKNLKAELCKRLEEASSSAPVASSSGCSSSKADSSETSDVNSDVSSSKEVNSDGADSSNGAARSVPEITVTDADESNAEAEADSKEKEAEPSVNGEVVDHNVSSSTVQENGVLSPKGKKKASLVTISNKCTRKSPRKKTLKMYQKLLEMQSSEDSEEDEQDSTFEGPKVSSDEDDDEENGSAEESDASSEESEEEDDEEKEEEDDDDDEEDDKESPCKFPGVESGSTAVVALLKGKKLYVANVGDSRCVLSREGKAIEMSFDHKPENEIETNRINAAGGKVTFEGRVNGGLNLSRAIGDFSYKQNKDLPLKDQMITALPDIESITIDPDKDEFMILACDGIWNSMSSQEVVDFVRSRLDKEKVSEICEELFEACLAPDTGGDGTGCDNMTAVIVQFKYKSSKKRPSSPEPDDENTSRKLAKTDEHSTISSA